VIEPQSHRRRSSDMCGMKTVTQGLDDLGRRGAVVGCNDDSVHFVNETVVTV